MGSPTSCIVMTLNIAFVLIGSNSLAMAQVTSINIANVTAKSICYNMDQSAATKFSCIISNSEIILTTKWRVVVE